MHKLDRISRSILEFANMMELFQEYDVEFVSSTEKFDTSTPMGRAMLNICIVFAQLERETIQKRVTDAYYSRCLKDQILVIAPHEALIPSDAWLKCRKKLMTNTTFQRGRKPKNTWLAGKIKCGHCGYALKATRVPNGTGYFRCTKRTENKGCPGCGKIHKDEFEQFVFTAMQAKFKDFQFLHGKEEKANRNLLKAENQSSPYFADYYNYLLISLPSRPEWYLLQ